MSSLLPTGFAALEPFVAAWAVEGTAARDRRRGESTEAERIAFFEAAKDLAAPALELLDRKPLADHDESERRLMNLMLGFAHVTMAVEMLGSAEPRHAAFRKVMRLTRSPADTMA
ncbi:MAG: hypothetical protein LBV50_08195 [Novosphingobium sp.]|jgi:hypothetical protein|nr:hypothetical protein [Novosphingobium sp.]